MSSTTKLAERATTNKTTIYAGIIAIVGAGLLWITSAHQAYWDSRTGWRAFLEQFGGLLVTTGVLAVLWDLRGKRDIIEEVLAKVQIGADIKAVGLRRASVDWKDVPWKALLTGSQNIDVFISYGSTWLSSNSVELAAFAKHRENKMRYVLPDPKDETTMKVLAQRYEYTVEMLISKVEEAAKDVARLSRNGSADIRVYYRKGAPTFTCYRFDKQVIVTLYSHKPGRGAVPTLMLDEGSFQDFFMTDLEAIHEQSREVPLQDLIGGTTSA